MMITALALLATDAARASDPHSGRAEPTAINFGYNAEHELYQLTQQFPSDKNLGNAYAYTYYAYTYIWTAWNYLFDSAVEGWTTPTQYAYEVNLADQYGYYAYLYAYNAWVGDQSPAKTQMYQDVFNMYQYIYSAMQQGAPPAPKVAFNLGPVHTSVQVVPIFWGEYWKTSDGASLISSINSFYDNLMTSPWMDLLTEYNTYDSSHNLVMQIGHGTRLAQNPITNADPPNALTAGQVASQLVAWINSGVIPSPNGNNTYYVVFIAPGQTFQQDRSNFITGGSVCDFSVIPYYPLNGYPAWAGSALDWYTVTTSRLLADTVTGLALVPTWGSSQGPPGTTGYLNSTPVRLSNGFLVNQTWSNLHGGPAITPGQ
jgi:hypothetical protein